jgi:hypothetical protein
MDFELREDPKAFAAWSENGTEELEVKERISEEIGMDCAFPLDGCPCINFFDKINIQYNCDCISNRNCIQLPA